MINDQKWPKMAKNGQKWPKMAKTNGCGFITVRRSRPFFYSLLSTKHELFSAVDFDGVIGGVFLILLL